MGRDRRQNWGHSSYGATQTPGKATESFDRATLMHFHAWQPQTDRFRALFVCLKSFLQRPSTFPPPKTPPRLIDMGNIGTCW
jgi:hypothetical protein